MRSLLLGVIVLLAGCAGDGFVDRATKVTFEPDTSNFWSLPMPSDPALQKYFRELNLTFKPQE